MEPEGNVCACCEESLSLLSMVDLDAAELEEFYNTCHGPDGKFCTTPGGRGGGAGGGRGVLLDNDGIAGRTTISEGKRGKRGASLVDPHDGTREIDGIRGYDSKGKPVPGSDAWLEAHGVSRQVFNSRPYVQFEANRNDPAIKEAFKDYPQAQRFWQQRLEQEGQSGGYIMYKHAVPGSPFGAVAPQVRPNKAVVTNPAEKARREKILENERTRLDVLKSTTPTTLARERRAAVKQTELNLERIKNATPEKVREEAARNVERAQASLKRARDSGSSDAIFEAQRDVVAAKRQQIKDERRARNWNPEKELYDAETSVKWAQARVARSIADPKAALADEIKSAERRVKRAENGVDKAAAKYVFSKGTESARIDMNPDPQNVKNLTSGKGRIYFAMEGSIKNDAILTALKKEDPTATVVNVPSVTLWQQKGGGEGEIRWFAQTHGKGRQVVLIPDADGINNPNVMAQAKALSSALRTFGVGDVVLAAPPLKKGTKRVIDHFNLPSGVDEGRKGVDDHLGAGRGTLGQLTYTKNIRTPRYDLSEYGKAAGGTGPKINRNAIKNTEDALAAISGIVGPEGSGRITKKMLAQAAGLPATSAKEARDRLEKLGIVSVEHIFDEQALSRGKRVRNPKVSDERVQELVRKGVIKEPRLDQPFTEVTIEESPVITIRDTRFRIKPEDVETGTLSELPNWSPPRSFTGWTSAVDGRPDSTGIAARVQDAATTNAQRNRARPTPVRVVEAPPGRRLVRSAEGAKRYGVPIGSPIPIGATESEEAGLLSTVSLDVVSTEMIVEAVAASVPSETIYEPVDLKPGNPESEFYNTCHGPDGRFCPTPGGSGDGGEGVRGRLAPGTGTVTKPSRTDTRSRSAGSNTSWPQLNAKRPITTVAQTRRGSVTVDGIKAKAVYEVTATNGTKIRLYDKAGNAGPYSRNLLNNHAKMHEMYPLRPPRGIVVTKPSGMFRVTEIDDRNTFATVYSRRPEYTYFNSEKLGFDVGRVPGGYQMPSARTGNTKNMDYILTHEYGHHLDFSKNIRSGSYHPHPFNGNSAFRQNMSRYGNTGNRLNRSVESYAEAFAEWHHSQGTTRNPAAIALARHEGWYGSGVQASGTMEAELQLPWFLNLEASDLVHFADLLSFQEEGETGEPEEGDTDSDIEADLPTPDDGGYGVTDDFEKGPKAIGTIETVQPTEEEIAKATALMAEVLRELEEGEEE